MQEPKVDLSLAIQHGLSEEEFEKIIEILGRIPNFTEIGIYSVMWSEHCSYKNSIALLKTLPKDGDKLLVKAGEENAGLIDIGDGMAICFKIESHNHPSAVEPYQGAATGIGGILRDIFTMGAFPIVALNSLRFGELDNPRSKYLFSQVVKGIGDYGNCFGVPTAAGEVYFEKCYQHNCLVNAMAVGIVDINKIAKAIAKEENSPVFIVGSSTGRDGIHGATFASETLTDESESRKSNVQVGDPFAEKLLLEATLEIIEKDLIIGIQDMGAAGIICSCSEMSARGKSGMIIDLDLVPLREKNMSAYEILLSESQERMLVIGKIGNDEKIKEIFKKWDLNCTKIGNVINENMLYFYQEGVLKAKVPAESLVLGGGAPVYYRESKIPEYIKNNSKINLSDYKEEDLENSIIKILSSPNIANKSWIYRQYDHTVGTNTIILPGESDATVIRIKDTQKAISTKTDCNSKYVYLNPKVGTMIAVAEAARNVVCTGAEPIAITNCLNFGNPYNPENYWQFKESIDGMSAACRAFKTPVTGGNVSFYNESENASIYPTPVIGMLGIINDINNIITSHFKNENDLIYVIGDTEQEIGGSEFQKVIYKKIEGDCPKLDLEKEKLLFEIILNLIKQKLIESAHDVSDGGLIITLIESCIMNKRKLMGAELSIDFPFRKDIYLFSESQSRVLVSVNPKNKIDFENFLNRYNFTFKHIGFVKKENLKINNTINLKTEVLSDIYYSSIKNIMDK